MSSFKEIVTKAVVGKAKKTSNNDFSMQPDEIPNTVLGCWVINHTFSGTKGSNGEVLINGAFDVNVWYSYNNDSKTAVSTKRFTYVDSIKVPLKDNADLNSNKEIIVRCLKQPTVSNVKTSEGIVNLTIEKELGVELVGDAKVKISVEDDYDDYDEIYDEKEDEVINNINEEYLSK